MCCCCEGVPEALFMFERHGEPAAEEGLPSNALRLQEAADDVCLECCQLGPDVHKGNATLLECPVGNISAGVQKRCPCHHWPVGRHEGVY